MSKFLLPDGLELKQDRMFALPMPQLIEAINTLENKEANMEEYVLLVPTDGTIGRWYITLKGSIK